MSIDRTAVKVAPLVAYVCRRCSLTELYMPGGERLPAGPQYGTALVDAAPGGQGPFR